MGQIVKLNANSDITDILDQLKGEADKGDLRGIVVIAEYTDNYDTLYSKFNTVELLGMIEILKNAIICAVKDED